LRMRFFVYRLTLLETISGQETGAILSPVAV